ncbi:murein biosynthesis integral membrane protein MurJ [Kitasatospora xanthocidica]|uniref:Murein biosynthesis integral membrane protein MurJ n=1 Tax=Kitasatospora xanthocidica TaxID=83382 RepID=A0A373A0E6_9ACTN|nr:murein biosynthesis integral membrane protein MurJ [Kitasatospora xanthocidica]RGD61224.1 murein biosynthesis integral membrane protein MurJ [Kitasatospora xanthocidica]
MTVLEGPPLPRPPLPGPPRPARHRRPRRTPPPSLVMAAGTVVSRATGFVRSALLVAVLGSGLLADGYNVANTVPNLLFVLLIGGALNTALVPHLVRAAKESADGGAAHVDRLVTVLVVTLLVLTAVVVPGAPYLVRAYTAYGGAQLDRTVLLAYLCLPQVFFYGLFTVLGQLLNARQRFAPMAWAPVLNNLVVIGVFAGYLGQRSFSTADVTVLGAGTTAGVVAQSLVLLPCLRAAGVRPRPRWDWRQAGLGEPLRAAGWTLLLVLGDQVGYWVVTRLSTSVGARAAEAGLPGVGYTAYSSAYLLWIVPHGVVTVSVVTAVVPALTAAADSPRAVRALLARTVRTIAVVTVPAACAFAVLAPQLCALAFGHGSTGADDVRAIAGMLTAFAPGLVLYSAGYALTRVFYALGDSRTPFLLNLLPVAATALGAVLCHRLLPLRWAVTGMAGCYGASFLLTCAAAALLLRRRLGPLRVLGAHGKPLLAALPAAAGAWWATRYGLLPAAAALAVGYLLLAHLLRIEELSVLTTRLRRRP